MTTAVLDRPAAGTATEALRRGGNPFRNYFARNPDDEVCARYHVPELFARERDQLLAIVDLYRYDPTAHSEVLPILGNKGAGKTHLLHSIKHGPDGGHQLLVTPGVYQRDTEFLEYLLFQTVDTLLGGGKQKGVRPLEFIGGELTRKAVGQALSEMTPEEQMELFPGQGLSKFARKFGFGQSAARSKCDELISWLTGPRSAEFVPVKRKLTEAGLEPLRAFRIVEDHVERAEPHNTAGLMRREITRGFAKAVLLGEESDLAVFLTHGFAELPFNVRPTRQELVLSLLKVLMGVFRNLKVPVVVAFDQLEDLLLARRSDDAHKIAEAFFAGIVQTMHQIDGVCILVFAERGLWNRFVPSLDGYIQDRLNNPIHLPDVGTVQSLRLESPPAELVREVVAARLRPALDEIDDNEVSPIFPFSEDQVERVARTEPTLRDMLQQFRHLFDKLVYGHGEEEPCRPVAEAAVPVALAVKSVEVLTSSDVPSPIVARSEPVPSSAVSLAELWDQEQRSARRRLEPDGALTAAARELQAGLGTFLQVCHEHGVKVGPWRLQHVVGEWAFGDHPSYGVLTIAHWACKDGPPWKVGIGLFLARGAGKPKDLEVKLSAADAEPTTLDHLILLRPEDDLALTGKSKSLWNEAAKRGRHSRLEAVSLDTFALISSFPRWLAAVSESLPEGQPLPNLADQIQDKCERLLEQVCMPVQG